MKNLKDLFIKSDDEEEAKTLQKTEKPSFPINEPVSKPSFETNKSNNPYLAEIIEIYEKGLESINMPGYDFYDFYVAVKAAGAHNETVYKMAFQMGKTLDSGITSQKLAVDAEYYISKINEVYQKYADQGRQKIDALASQQRNESSTLSSEVSQIESEINKLKQQIQTLDRKLSETKATLSKVDEKYKPQQEVVQQKLVANDQAMQMSVQKINTIKDGIGTFLK
ncbi:hypothetical protein WSM22_35070 [Cytophagales bacterium WSM2-2]|nr:hypothetical protein WSM22_35070 [Cytophagales bacterium WSM2-2]